MSTVEADTTTLDVTVGEWALRCVFERELAPLTCAAFEAQLPFESRLIHCRWTGESAWMPLGDLDLGIGHENALTYASPGQVLFYPGGISETEMLLPYGASSFASKAGPLAANHFLTVVEGTEHLRAIGEHVLWHGALDIKFERSGS